MIKNRLKIILAERDLNLSKLAEMAGVHYTTLRRFASDEAESIHKPTLDRVCQVLGVQPGDVFIHRPNEVQQPPESVDFFVD